jgi:hypothetical protein
VKYKVAAGILASLSAKAAQSVPEPLPLGFRLTKKEKKGPVIAVTASSRSREDRNCFPCGCAFADALKA